MFGFGISGAFFTETMFARRVQWLVVSPPPPLLPPPWITCDLCKDSGTRMSLKCAIFLATGVIQSLEIQTQEAQSFFAQVLFGWCL